MCRSRSSPRSRDRDVVFTLAQVAAVGTLPNLADSTTPLADSALATLDRPVPVISRGVDLRHEREHRRPDPGRICGFSSRLPRTATCRSGSRGCTPSSTRRSNAVVFTTLVALALALSGSFVALASARGHRATARVCRHVRGDARLPPAARGRPGGVGDVHGPAWCGRPGGRILLVAARGRRRDATAGGERPRIPRVRSAPLVVARRDLLQGMGCPVAGLKVRPTAAGATEQACRAPTVEPQTTPSAGSPAPRPESPFRTPGPWLKRTRQAVVLETAVAAVVSPQGPCTVFRGPYNAAAGGRSQHVWTSRHLASRLPARSE